MSTDFAEGTFNCHARGRRGPDDRVRRGTVLVNGDEPDGSPACADVEAIVVEGGEGPNEIDLSGVNGTDFPGLFAPAFEERITIDGRGGGYTVIGSELAENIVGGLGDVLDGRGEGDFYSAHATAAPARA